MSTNMTSDTMVRFADMALRAVTGVVWAALAQGTPAAEMQGWAAGVFVRGGASAADADRVAAAVVGEYVERFAA